jgi:hypothetical protein
LEFDAFTFRLKPEIHEMELADTVRVEVAVQYKTRAWQTVDIDLGPGGAREADLVEPAITGLTELGLAMAPMCAAWASTSRSPKSCMPARGRSERTARVTFWIFCWCDLLSFRNTSRISSALDTTGIR